MRKRLTNPLISLLCIVLIAGAYQLYARLAAAVAGQLSLKYGADMHSVICVLCVPAGILLGYPITRAGYLIFGLLSGCQLVECSIFGLGLHRSADGRLRFAFRRPMRRLCALLKPPAYDGTSPYRLHTAGGALACAIVGALMLAASLLIRSTPEMYYVGLIALLLFAWALVLILHPTQGVLVQLRQYAANLHHRRAREHHMIVQANTRQGRTLSDLPEDFFLPYPQELWHDPTILIAQHNISSWMISTGRYEQAHETLLQLMQVFESPDLKLPHKDIQRLYFTCTCAMAEMLSGAPPVYSERLNEPNIELFLGGGSWGTHLLLAKYIRELLVTRNAPAAQQLLNRLHNTPTPLSASQRRLLQEAQAMAAQHTQQEAPNE